MFVSLEYSYLYFTSRAEYHIHIDLVHRLFFVILMSHELC